MGISGADGAVPHQRAVGGLVVRGVEVITDVMGQIIVGVLGLFRSGGQAPDVGQSLRHGGLQLCGVARNVGGKGVIAGGEGGDEPGVVVGIARAVDLAPEQVGAVIQHHFVEIENIILGHGHGHFDLRGAGQNSCAQQIVGLLQRGVKGAAVIIELLAQRRAVQHGGGTGFDGAYGAVDVPVGVLVDQGFGLYFLRKTGAQRHAVNGDLFHGSLLRGLRGGRSFAFSAGSQRQQGAKSQQKACQTSVHSSFLQFESICFLIPGAAGAWNLSGGIPA